MFGAFLGRLHAAALPELKRRLSLQRAAGRAVSSGASPASRRMVVATLHLGRSGYGRWGGRVTSVISYFAFRPVLFLALPDMLCRPAIMVANGV
jgi:hypothetical protein